jgi:hypothetical protein
VFPYPSLALLHSVPAARSVSFASSADRIRTVGHDDRTGVALLAALPGENRIARGAFDGEATPTVAGQEITAAGERVGIVDPHRRPRRGLFHRPGFDGRDFGVVTDGPPPFARRRPPRSSLDHRPDRPDDGGRSVSISIPVVPTFDSIQIIVAKNK